MTTKKITKKRAKLLADLEYLVGNNCYNGSIQNWGPGGTFEGEGRGFRYPLTVIGDNGGKIKRRYRADDVAPKQLITGYYAFGANQLQIVLALEEVLQHLEKNYGLKL
ncbi:MAG: hypothetical protein EOS28_23240 [Mesorhizobium sp.]|nr:MAG: hypothetical protein EOS28_23240 [Mesorhizobium sp.]